jgi:membrane fusion protein, heavy metal efflux system
MNQFFETQIKHNLFQMKYICIIAVIAFISGCNANQNSHVHTHELAAGAEIDDHAHEPGVLSYTVFSEGHELFVEFPPLAVGQTSSFGVHFTELSSYKPVVDGRLTVSMIKGNKGIRQTVEKPSSPGIFRPSLQPQEAGTYQLVFMLETESGTETFEMPAVTVYATADEAAHAPIADESGDDVTFLKEQAWKTEFNTMEVIPTSFYSVIHTSGKVNVQPQSQVTISSPAAGTIQLYAVAGQPVNRGDLLAFVSGSGIDNNMSLRLNEMRIAFEKSRVDFLRSVPLARNQVISQKDFLDIEARYQQDSLRYHQLADLVSEKGIRIIAPAGGFITNINIENGHFIEAGNPMFTVVNQTQLLIETYVNQSDFQKVKDIFDANFKLPDKNTIISLQDINGRINTKDAFVNENFSRIPVIFSVVNNGMLMPGMFLESFLFTDQREDALVVPLSSLLEEHGHYFVYVQTGGESFTRREVWPGNNDGKNVQINSGLIPGERIVTKGATQIKLAEMTGIMPIHGHTH